MELVSYVRTGSTVPVAYDAEQFLCDFQIEDRAVRMVYNSELIAVVIIPMITITVTTVWLLMYVSRQRGLQRQGVVTLIAISVVFCVAFVPYACYPVLRFVVTGDSYQYYRRFAGLMTYCNIAANPIIYLGGPRMIENRAF